MPEQVVILIERKGRKQFTRFVELFKNRPEIPIKEIRSQIPKSTFYEFILSKLYTINQSIKHINPSLEHFIIPAFSSVDGRIIQTFRKNCNIEIVDEDPNFFYLKLKMGNDEIIKSN